MTTEIKNKIQEYRYNKLLKDKLYVRTRLLSQMTIVNECWEYSRRNNKEYGILSYKSENYLAHRVSWMIYNNKKLKDRWELICHKCDNPSCINPKHLFKGTVKDNSLDMMKKGRQNFYKFPKYSGENHPKSTISKDIIIEVYRLVNSGHKSKDVAAKFNLCKYFVSKIKCHRHWATRKLTLSEIKNILEK